MKSFTLQPSRPAGNQDSKANGASSILGVLIFIGFVWYLWGGGIEMDSAKRMNDTYKQVSENFVQEYEIAKRQGDPVQICVQAGIAAAAFLQQKDEPSYQRWKAIEQDDCARAGVPR